MGTNRRTTGKSVESVTASVYAQRNHRLRLLIDLEHDGVISDLIRKSDPEGNRSRSSYISQIQSGHRPFTEPAARRIEIECGKPIGWLDGRPDEALDALIVASNLRIDRLREHIAQRFDGDKDKLCSEWSLGPRRQKLVSDLLDGSRYLSINLARDLETDIGLPQGFLDQE